MLLKRAHAGGGLQCLRPRPAGVGSCPHAPASAWLRGSPPLPLGTLGEPRTRIRQTSESGGGGGGAWNSSPRQCTPDSFRRPMDSWLGWKRWLGGALCPRAGALGGRLPSASQQMPQLELHLYFYAPSLHQCSLPRRGALRREPSVTRGCCVSPGPGLCRGGRRWVGGHLWRLSLVLVTVTPAPPRRGKGACVCFLELSAQPFTGLSTRRRFPEGCFSVRRAESGG